MLSITNHQRNANQNHNGISPYTVGIAVIKKKKITSVGEDVEKREPSCTVGGNVISATTTENSMEVPQKIKSRITI